MAEKKFLDYDGLKHYDAKIKAYIEAEDQKVADLISGEDGLDSRVETLEANVGDMSLVTGTLAAAIAGEATRAQGEEAKLAATHATKEDGSFKTVAEEVNAALDAVVGDHTVATEGTVNSRLTALENSTADAEALAALDKKLHGEDGTAGEIGALDGRLEAVEDLIGTETVASQIEAAVEELKYEDAAEAGKFVTAVSEADGVIAVTRAALTADDIPTLTLSKISDAGTAAAADVATVAIGGEDAVGTALPTVAHVKTYVDAAVEAINGDAEALEDKVEALEGLHATKEDGSFKSVADEVNEAVTDLIDGAPEALDTLKEIADWIANQDESGVTDAATLVARVETNAQAIADETERATGAEEALGGRIDDVEELIGTIPETATAETVVGYAKELVDAEEAARKAQIGDLGKVSEEEGAADHTVKSYVDAAVVAAVTGDTGVGPRLDEVEETLNDSETGLVARVVAIETDLANTDSLVEITDDEIDELFK